MTYIREGRDWYRVWINARGEEVGRQLMPWYENPPRVIPFEIQLRLPGI